MKIIIAGLPMAKAARRSLASQIGPLGMAVLAVPLIAWFVVIGLYAGFGEDAHAYWLTGHRPDLYTTAPGTHNAFLYSPAFAQLVRPIAWLPWPTFLAVWMITEAVAFAWLVRPLGRWAPLAFAACLPEIALGNVYGFFAVVLVVGFKRPMLWAFPLLTKISPGLGALWFVARGEWRALSRVLLWTAGIVVLSVATWPSAWRDWLLFLTSHRGDVRWEARIALGFVTTIFAARMDRRWLLAPAMVLASPVLAWVSPFTVLLSIPRLRHLPRVHNSRTDLLVTPAVLNGGEGLSPVGAAPFTSVTSG